MCFLIAMDDEPVRSLSSVMAAKIPALYDMVDDVLLETAIDVTVTNKNK